MAQMRNEANDRTLRQWVVDDLAKAGISDNRAGVHRALLDSQEMEPVWQLLRKSEEKFHSIGAVTSLVLTLGGLLRGPHKTQLMCRSERLKKARRIDKFCADLASELAGLRDIDLGLPLSIIVALEESLDSAVEEWKHRYLTPAWTKAVLGMTEALEQKRGTEGDLLMPTTPSHNCAFDICPEKLEQNLISNEAKESKEAIDFAMEQLKEDTELWLQRSITKGLEPLLWALQDGVREWANEPQIIRRPRDESEQWAFVIRGVHDFFRRHFKRSMPGETAIVVRAIQDGAMGNAKEPSALISSRVCDIVSMRERKRSA